MGIRKGVAVTVAAGAVATGVAIPAPAGADAGGLVRGVVAITNAVRARAGCGPVTANARLNHAAWAHSRDMAMQGYFSHGATGVRVRAAGYRWAAYGENIAWGQRSAGEVMDDWMSSPGHRANILDCRFRNVGVAVVYNGRGVPFWTQDFATPR
ncbi:CAP domain-containing protein [Dactylosporangium sucinum]|uniref:SCP domain-containing protein n=1 Tax=Dactylosporangium sucinum TaxID=1424081 RepID=A0A917TVZ7_9ACTN|nr:CAP domain-containing protein [Dactylosporangium sucinum]GGM38623.1 hypothetical protein GCM10007977_045110 [Dactylosporangium sucinum]